MVDPSARRTFIISDCQTHGRLRLQPAADGTVVDGCVVAHTTPRQNCTHTNAAAIIVTRCPAFSGAADDVYGSFLEQSSRDGRTSFREHCTTSRQSTIRIQAELDGKVGSSAFGGAKTI